MISCSLSSPFCQIKSFHDDNKVNYLYLNGKNRESSQVVLAAHAITVTYSLSINLSLNQPPIGLIRCRDSNAHQIAALHLIIRSETMEQSTRDELNI